MRDAMLNAVSRAVSLYRGAYTFDEATSCATVEFDLDEFEAEDLPVLVRNQVARLKLQLGENY